MNTSILIIISILLLSKIFIAIWVYKDAKGRGINPLLWSMLVLVFSGSLTFLLYVLVVRKERNIQCKNCNFIQTEKLLYCGRCGSEINIDPYDENNNDTNKIILVLGVALLIIGIISGVLLTFNTVWKDKPIMTVSLMSASSKYNNVWKDKFKYKNGSKSHTFKIKEDRTKLNIDWDINDGYMEAKLYKDDELIKEINSKDYPIYKETIDLSEHIGDKVILNIKFKKTSGRMSFLLE